MSPIFDQSDPTWIRDITTETVEEPSKKKPTKSWFPAAVVFTISAVVASAAGSPAPIPVESESSSTEYRLHNHPEPFADRAQRETWDGAMKTIRDWGADPDEIVRRAGETIAHWRKSPDRDEYVDGFVSDEDEV